MLPAAIPSRIILHTLFNVCAIVVMEEVTIDQENHMICCGQAVDSQVSASLHDYDSECLLLLLAS